ncbi:hypothetical protein BHC44_09595 [Snodgrassella alvi]|uniref:Uncharacterized protein n=1 Tax=Snodgrassella alvi TaxID=1196083 RepID=A0A2N9XXI2_9NEIS|nr:hypothetical protein [Snodgrassella alvi]PIT51853.1 hypothetical protein BHC44_09595 [Snodgrassella alvi]PIT54694.1 hypothetical protein BHC49_07640 [Snodgrassella alvi]
MNKIDLDVFSDEKFVELILDKHATGETISNLEATRLVRSFSVEHEVIESSDTFFTCCDIVKLQDRFFSIEYEEDASRWHSAGITEVFEFYEVKPVEEVVTVVRYAPIDEN